MAHASACEAGLSTGVLIAVMSIAAEPLDTRTAPRIEMLFMRLRALLRRYVVIEGTARLIGYVCLAGLLAIGLDWLCDGWLYEGLRPDQPSETAPDDRGPRLVVLTCVILGALGIAYRSIVSRLLFQLPDRSLALLVERKFPRFQESLVTTIEMRAEAPRGTPAHQQMLAHTRETAEALAADVDPRALLDRRPVRRAAAFCLAGIACVGLFALLAPGSLAFGLARVTTLTDQRWPRDTSLSIEGFPNGVAVVAIEDDLNMVVRADASLALPDRVQIRYAAADGTRSWHPLEAMPAAKGARDDGFRRYRYRFYAIVAPIDFEVAGGDDRLRHLRIDVVGRPALEIKLHCEFPSYLSMPQKTLDAGGTVLLPVGTRVMVECRSTKSLREAQVESAGTGEPFPPRTFTFPADGADRRTFAFPLEPLSSDTTLSFQLLDTDQVQPREPIRLALVATPDLAPVVRLALAGIGTAITPQARLPLQGLEQDASGRRTGVGIRDDRAVAAAWIETTTNKDSPRMHPLRQDLAGKSQVNVDDEALEVSELHVKPGDKLTLLVRAQDYFSLPGRERPNVGQSSALVLDVVTPADLRSMLVKREIQQRLAFDETIAQLTRMRDKLAAAGDRATAAPPAPNPAAPPVPPVDARLAVGEARGATHELSARVQGTADSFEGICVEMINNRIITDEVQVRLRDRIAVPLAGVAGPMFAELERRLTAWNAALGDPKADVASRQIAAVGQADAILVEMQAIQRYMLELETFNEAVDRLRAILAAQRNIHEQTQKLRIEKARKLQE